MDTFHPLHFVRRGLAATFRRLAAVTSPPPKTARLQWVEVASGPIQGCRLYVDVRDGPSREMASGTHDTFMIDILRQAGLLEAGRRVWDVGAHIGYDALVLAHFVSPSGRVVAFEPNPYAAELLRQHLARNPTLAGVIDVSPYALSDRCGGVMLRCSSSPFLSTIGYLDHLPVPGDRIPAASYRALVPVPVESVTADSLLADGWAAPDLLKIDVEGAEADVLTGARHLLTDHRPALAIEVHNIRNMHLMHHLLAPLGYRLRFEDDPEHPSSSRGFVFASHESHPVF